jgi:hypothetical protein
LQRLPFRVVAVQVGGSVFGMAPAVYQRRMRGADRRSGRASACSGGAGLSAALEGSPMVAGSEPGGKRVFLRLRRPFGSARRLGLAHVWAGHQLE